MTNSFVIDFILLYSPFDFATRSDVSPHNMGLPLSVQFNLKVVFVLDSDSKQIEALATFDRGARKGTRQT